MIRAIAVTTFAALLWAPVTVHAQEPLGGWRGLNVSALDTIYVTDDAGRQTEGKLLRLEPDSVVMLVEGAEQRFDAARVRRIDRRGDSLKNGTLIGVAIGVALGLVTAGIADCIDSDRPGSSCAGGRIALFAVSTGVYDTATCAMRVNRSAGSWRVVARHQQQSFDIQSFCTRLPERVE